MRGMGKADNQSGTTPSEFRTGWGVVLAGTLASAWSVSVLGATYTLGPLTEPLSQAFGWTRAEIGFAVTMLTVGVVTMSFLVGWLVDRVGSFRVLAASQCAFGLSFFLVPLIAHDLTSFYLAYLVIAFAGAGTIPIPVTKRIGRDFEKRRGLAIGIALSGSGLCALAAPPIVAFATAHYGWQGAYVAIGLLPLLFGLPLTLVFFRERRSAAVGEVTQLHAPAPADRIPGLTFPEAVRRWRWWAMALAFGIVSAAVTGLFVSALPLLTDRGIPRASAAEMVGIFGVTVIAGRLIVGFLVDRFWGPGVALLFLLPAAAACLYLTGDETARLPLLVALGLVGLAAGAEYDLASYLCTRYFGVAHFGKIYAGQYILFALGGGLAAPFYGWIYDTTGGYDGALIASAFGFLACAALLLALGRYPRWTRAPAEG
jgi:predicted MFS family arabinose efflux permease